MSESPSSSRLPVVDGDLRTARTLPGVLFNDPALHALARQRVFARSWQLAGEIGSLGEPGSFRPFTFLPGCVEEPLLLTRDGSGSVRALSNVCTHRGAVLCDAPDGPAGSGAPTTVAGSRWRDASSRRQASTSWRASPPRTTTSPRSRSASGATSSSPRWTPPSLSTR